MIDNILAYQSWTLRLVYTTYHHHNANTEISESVDGVLVTASFARSQLVLVSTSSKLPSLHESQFQNLIHFPVSMSLSLNIQERSCPMVEIESLQECQTSNFLSHEFLLPMESRHYVKKNTLGSFHACLIVFCKTCVFNIVNGSNEIKLIYSLIR